MRAHPALVSMTVLVALGAGHLEAGMLLVANKSDHTLSFVSPDTGETAATLPTGRNPHEVAVSPDGRIAVVANYGGRDAGPGSSLTVVDVTKREVLRTIELGSNRRPHGIAFLPGGGVAVTTEGSQKLLVVDPASGEILRAVATNQGVSHMVAVTPDGKRAFVANIGSGSVTVIDLEKGEKTRDVKTGAGAEAIGISPDGKEVWVGNRGADTLTVIDASSLEVLAEIPCKGFPIRLTFTPDGKHVLVSCARSGEVAVFDRAARVERVRRELDLSAVEGTEGRLFGDTFGGSPVPVGLLVVPDGSRAFVAATQADVVVVMDPRTLEVHGLLRAGREPDGMAYVR